MPDILPFPARTADVPGSFDHAAAHLADTQAPGSIRVFATLAFDRRTDRVGVIWLNTVSGDKWVDTIDLAGLCLLDVASTVACRDLAKVRDEVSRRCYFAIN